MKTAGWSQLGADRCPQSHVCVYAVGVTRPSKQREHQGRQSVHQRSARYTDAAGTGTDLLVVRQDHQRAHHLRQSDRFVCLPPLWRRLFQPARPNYSSHGETVKVKVKSPHSSLGAHLPWTRSWAIPLLSAMRGQCDVRPYQPHGIVALSRYQIILLGSRGTCGWTTCSRSLPENAAIGGRNLRPVDRLMSSTVTIRHRATGYWPRMEQRGPPKPKNSVHTEIFFSDAAMRDGQQNREYRSLCNVCVENKIALQR